MIGRRRVASPQSPNDKDQPVMSATAERRTPRDYRHFPAEYDTILREYDRLGIYSFTFPTERDARLTTRELNRYRESLRHAVEGDPANEYVRTLCQIITSLVIRCYADDAGSWHVDLTVNPAVAAIRARTADTAANGGGTNGKP